MLRGAQLAVHPDSDADLEHERLEEEGSYGSFSADLMWAGIFTSMKLVRE